MHPRARARDLLIQELPEETLVYDQVRHRAHCLNRTAALVWRRCDGRTSVAELAQVLAREAQLPPDGEAVWAVLHDLSRAHLLEERIIPPEGAPRSRREALQRLGAVAGLAVLLPAVQSIVAPTAAQAASLVDDKACRDDPGPNAGKCCITNLHSATHAPGGSRLWSPGPITRRCLSPPPGAGATVAVTA